MHARCAAACKKYIQLPRARVIGSNQGTSSNPHVGIMYTALSPITGIHVIHATSHSQSQMVVHVDIAKQSIAFDVRTTFCCFWVALLTFETCSNNATPILRALSRYMTPKLWARSVLKVDLTSIRGFIHHPPQRNMNVQIKALGLRP